MTPRAYAAVGAFCLMSALGLFVWACIDLERRSQPKKWRPPVAIILSGIAVAMMVYSGDG